MASVAHPRLDPWEFFALQCDVGWTLPLEFVDGETIVIPPTGASASSAQGRLFHALAGWQEASGDGGLLLQDVFVAFPGGQYVAPDIAWWSAAHRPSERPRGAVDVIPDLVVEVLSPKTRENDLGIKRALYLATGVRELWLVDPQAGTVTRALPDGRDEALSRLESALLPGFALDVAAIFAD